MMQISNIEFSSGAVEKNNTPAAITNEITHISQQSTVNTTHTNLLLSAAFILFALLLSVKLPEGKNIETERSIAVGH